MNWLLEAISSGLLVGLALGMTGGGGSILAVPLLLYVLGFDLRGAVMVSLAVVGLTSLFGALLQRKEVFWRAGAVLGGGGIFGAPLGAWFGRTLPEEAVLLLFAGLMIFIALRFLRGTGATEVPMTRFRCAIEPGETRPRFHAACAGKLVVAGAGAGVLAGMFGVGGGFLLVPALMIVASLPLQAALSTSLLGIAILSAVSFLANQTGGVAVAWDTAALFMFGAFVGMVVGTFAKRFVPTLWLRRAFAISVLLIAIAMIIQTLVFR